MEQCIESTSLYTQTTEDASCVVKVESGILLEFFVLLINPDSDHWTRPNTLRAASAYLTYVYMPTPGPLRINPVLKWEEVGKGPLEHLSEGVLHDLVDVTKYAKEPHFLTASQEWNHQSWQVDDGQHDDDNVQDRKWK
jgi:hypothetical protein